VISKGFDIKGHYFVKALDAALASFHVERQAYYSGTFVGNHVHRYLKVNTLSITHTLLGLLLQPQHIPKTVE
jgi:hypothetical protein